MRKLLISFFLFGIYSCIPLSIAPNIETYKIVKTKRFKRNLPRGYGLVFEDPKDANEFYYFIMAKFGVNFDDYDSNFSFQLNDKDYYLTFYQREKSTRTLNLILIAIDSKRASNGRDPLFEDSHVTRKGKWYIVLMVFDNELRDCLKPNHLDRNEVTTYLEDLRVEYLHTQNYVETFLKRE